MDFANMIGKPLAECRLDDDKQRVVFVFKDGSRRAFGVAGDCCSVSWIEHLETPPDLDGAVIESVRDSDELPPWDGHDCTPPRACDHDCLTVYHTVFGTNRGEIVLEYRNDSNGYYGGFLVDAE